MLTMWSIFPVVPCSRVTVMDVGEAISRVENRENGVAMRGGVVADSVNKESINQSIHHTVIPIKLNPHGKMGV